MAWLNLIIAAAFEVGWPLGMKLADTTAHKAAWLVFAGVAMVLSGVFLYLAQKEIPIGTAYAVWTGIGTGCTFLIGVLFFNDGMTLMRGLGVLLITAGVAMLKYGH